MLNYERGHNYVSQFWAKNVMRYGYSWKIDKIILSYINEELVYISSVFARTCTMKVLKRR